jgi:hypothetical protein
MDRDGRMRRRSVRTPGVGFLVSPTAAAVMVHASEELADPQVAPRRVRLVQHPVFAVAVALDPQEPRRECPERLVQRLLAGRQRIIAVAALVALGHGPAGHRAGPWPHFALSSHA